jgi:ribosomal protein S18 acetylase RimI-like enzyme
VGRERPEEEFAVSEVAFRLAGPRDIPRLLTLLPLYYEADHLLYDPIRAEAAMRLFLSNPHYGWLWLIESHADHSPVGYLALTFGFSFEFGGREAFVDELFVRSEWQGQGIGSEAIRHAVEACRQESLASIRLEVTPSNPRALALYERLGFRDLGRSLLAFPLDAK